VGGERCREAKPGEQRPGRAGQLTRNVNGLTRGIETSKRVKAAGRAVLRREIQGDRELSLLGERGPIVRGESRQVRESVCVGETAGDKVSSRAQGTLVDNRKGVGSPVRGGDLS